MNYKLSEIMELIGGGTPKTSIPDYWNGDIPWLSVKDFNNESRYVYKTEKSITKMGLENSSTKLLSKDDTIISARGTVGAIAMIPFPMAFNQSCYGLRAKAKIVDSVFLYYLIKHNVYILKKNTHGSVFDTITRDTFDRIEVDIPHIELQKKIASGLSLIDDKIELNNKINDNLLNQIDSHFRALYIDFEQNNGLIPDNFRYGILDELSKEIICGKTPSTKNESYYGGDIPFITIPDMHDKVYVIKTERYLSEEGANSQIKKFLPRNSICVSCIGTAGLVALVNESSHTNQQINSIIPKENVSPYYVYSLMKTLKDKIISLGQCGSTIVNLNKVQFSKLEVLIPTEQSMSEFDQRVKPMFEQINLLQLENEKLSSLRDSLLPKLMSGEIDVDSIEL